MVEISLSGSGEGPGWATSRGYSTTNFKDCSCHHFGTADKRVHHGIGQGPYESQEQVDAK